MGGQLQSAFGNGSGAWLSLTAGIESQGFSLNITAAEGLCTALTSESLFKISAIASLTAGFGGTAANVYGSIQISNSVIECANPLLVTSNSGLWSPIYGNFSVTGQLGSHPGSRRRDPA